MEQYIPNLGELCKEDARRDAVVEYRLVAYAPAYRVGDDGSVWSCWVRGGVKGKRNGGTICKLGSVWRKINPTLNTHGYPIIYIRKGAKRHAVSVHKLVLEAFVGCRPDGMEAAHENGNRADNRLSNLSWKTHQDNQKDQIRHGTICRGSRNGWAKLTEESVVALMTDWRNGSTNKTNLGRKYGVSRRTVGLIIAGQRWQHVTEKRVN